MTLTDDGAGNYELTASPIDDTLVGQSPLALVLEILLPSQPNHVGIQETLTVTVDAATCDCSLITWDNPASASTLTVGVADTSSNTITIPEATVNSASQTAVPEIRVCAITTPCDVTYTNALVNVDLGALPAFMSVSGTTLTVTPTTSAHLGTWPLQLTQTVTSGTSPVFEAIIVTVDCTLTDVADPGNPATQTYYIYDPTMTIDLTALGTVYTQTPPCELAVSESYAWTIDAGAVAVTETADPMVLTVVSNLNTEAGTFTATLVNTITYASQSFTATPTVTFTIEVIDKCTITTFHDVTVNPITMILGDVATEDFAEATTQTETDNAGLWLCGDRVYEIVDASDVGITWMPITGSAPYTITASPTDEALVTGSSLDYYLKITFADARYPNPVKRMSLPVTITDATCDCDQLTWDTPAMITDAVEVALGPLTVTMPTAT